MSSLYYEYSMYTMQKIVLIGKFLTIVFHMGNISKIYKPLVERWARFRFP